METFEIDHPHNEASALLGIQSPAVLETLGWDVGFWIVSDELEASKALAALGQTADGDWQVVRVKTSDGKPWTGKNCEDCETLARAGSHVYVFGSQYGSKEGPLEPRRHFVARFNEALLDVSSKGRISVEMDLVRKPFALHRIVNDALQERGIELLRLQTPLHEAFVGAVADKGKEKKKGWRKLVRRDDVPINIEGATFMEGGRLLIGLRYPVTTDGHPIVVEVEGIDRLFEHDASPPLATAVRILTSIGDRRTPAGIRELDARGGVVHVITGDLDDELIQQSSASAHAPSEHWTFDYEYGDAPLFEVRAIRVRKFGDDAQVEGIALDGEDVWYVHDDENIRVARARSEG